jgi:hypothetical protein
VVDTELEGVAYCSRESPLPKLGIDWLNEKSPIALYSRKKVMQLTGDFSPRQQCDSVNDGARKSRSKSSTCDVQGELTFIGRRRYAVRQHSTRTSSGICPGCCSGQDYMLWLRAGAVGQTKARQLSRRKNRKAFLLDRAARVWMIIKCS